MAYIQLFITYAFCFVSIQSCIRLYNLLMLSRENIQKIFQQAQRDENNKINIATAETIVKKLGIPIYKPLLTQMVRKINRSLPPGKQQDSLDLQNLVLLVELLSNQFEKGLWEMISDLKSFTQQLKQELKQRDMSVRDREFEGKFVFKVGPIQQYLNFFKFWLTKKHQKKITVPWISIDIEAKEVETREKLSQALKQTFETVMNLLKGENPGMESSLNQISFQPNVTEKGVQVIVQMRNKKLDELQVVASDVLNLMFQIQVNGQIQFHLKTKKNFEQLFDKSKEDHLLSIIDKDCQIIMKGSVNRIMTGLKELLISSEEFIDLKYDRLYGPALIAIALTNMQVLDGELVFDNIQSSNSVDLQLVQARNQLLEFFQGFEELPQMLEAFKINRILQLIGDNINVEMSFGKYNFGIDLRINSLRQVLYKLLGLDKGMDGSNYQSSQRQEAGEQQKSESDQ